MDDQLRRRYLDLNGRHPMTEADDAYVRELFVEVPDEPDWPREKVHELMLGGELPLPSYLTSDGEPMVHPDYLELLRENGSPDRLRTWFLEQWPADEREVAEAEWKDYVSGQSVCLYSVNPTTIRRKTELIEAIKALVARVDAGETTARTELGTQVDALDELEPPFAAYDRLRFEGPVSRDVWIDDVRAKYLS